MHQDANTLFEKLWDNYLEVTPSAEKVKAVLGGDSQSDIINDHIALRTFNIEKIGLEKLAAHFIAVGYREAGEYHFEKKKLYAKHFEHDDPKMPKVFISELLLEKCSKKLRNTINELVDHIEESAVTADNFLYSGRHWPVSFELYQALLEESEYAAWMAAWGFRANHFTVSNNHLENFDSIEEINGVLKKSGFALNTSGGEIKGTPSDFLEQSSTLADHHPGRIQRWNT